MIHHKLQCPEQNGGFTDLFILGTTRASGSSDFTETTNDTDQAITLTALAQGDCVHEVILDRVTAFAGLTACNASVGVTGSLTEFIGSSSMLAAGELTFKGDDQAYSTPTGGKNLVVNMDPGANTEALSDLTAGELYVWARITRRADRVTRLVA